MFILCPAFSLTGYFQPSSEVFIQPFELQSMELESGMDRAFICNGTVAGNSSVGLQWGVYNSPSPSTLPEVPSEGLTVSNLTEETIQDLCQGLSGAYSLPLQSSMAPSSSVITAGPTGPNGAVFLHLRSALLICGASTFISDTYSCFATNTSNDVDYRVFLTLSIPSAVVSYVIGVVVAIVVLTLLVMSLILLMCWSRYRSKKRDPFLMEPEPSFPVRSGSRHGIVNPTFPAFDTSPLEFPRDKLSFICILGKRILMFGNQVSV